MNTTRNKRSIITTAAATLVAAAVAVGTMTVGTASASPTAASAAGQSAASPTAHAADGFTAEPGSAVGLRRLMVDVLGPRPGKRDALSCDDLQKATAMVHAWTDVIGADAALPGSTLWMQAELTKAHDAGKTQRADHLQKVLDSRSTHPDRWSKVLTGLQAAQAQRCS